MKYVDSITIDPSIQLGIKSSKLLFATIQPEDAQNTAVEWKSSDPTIATINPVSGMVYAKNPGTATIIATATDGSGKSASCLLTVASKTLVTKVILNPTITTQNIGWSGYIRNTVCPTNATNKTLMWTSSNTDVASVNSTSGLITALSSGVTTITAKATDGSGISASCSFTVKSVPVKSIKLNPSKCTVDAGWVGYICKEICPVNATNQNLFWWSSDSSVANINMDTGLITALKVGETTIFAESQDGSGQSGSCTLTVRNVNPVPVTGVALRPSIMNQNVGWTGYISACAYPANATTTALKWSSSNPLIAEVNPVSGRITAKNLGSTIIMAEATDGSGAVSQCYLSIVEHKMMPPYNNQKLNIQDFCVSAPGMDAVFSRTYDAMDSRTGPFGNSWIFSYYGSCTESGGTQIVDIAGNIMQFTINKNEYVGINTKNRLIKNADGTFTLTTTENTEFNFNTNGYLTKITDRNNNSTTIELDIDTNYPTKVTDSTGRTYSITYEDNLIHAISINDADEVPVKTYCYEYTNGRLTASKNPKGEIIHTYEYYDDGNLRQVCDAWGNVKRMYSYTGRNVTSETDEYGQTTQYYYGDDGSGNYLTTAVSGKDLSFSIRDQFNHIVLDSEGTEYVYENNCGDISYYKTLDGQLAVFSYTDDADKNLSSVIIKDEEGHMIYEANHTYGYSNHRVILHNEIIHKYEIGNTKPISTTKKVMTYDQKGNLLTSVNEEGEKTERIEQSYTEKGLIHKYTGANDTTITYEYDSFGNPKKIIEEDKCCGCSTINNSYNRFGQILTKTKDNGLKISYMYDLLDNVVKETQDDGEIVKTTRTVYDNFGRKTQEVLPGEYLDKYDSISNIGHGLCSTNAYNDSSAGVRYIYGDHGKLKQKIDHDMTIDYLDSGKTSAVNVSGERLITYNYTDDARELLLAEIHANGQMITYEYDGDDLARVYHNGELAFKYCYNDEGVRVSEFDFLNCRITNYLANADGSNTVEVRNMANGTLISSRTTFTDGTTFYKTADKETSGVSHCYSDDNLTETEQHSVNSSVLHQQTSVLDDKNMSNVSCSKSSTACCTDLVATCNKYDSDGNVIEQTTTYADCSEDKLQYSYTSDGNVKAVTCNCTTQFKFHYDISNQLVRVDDNVRKETIAFTYKSLYNVQEKRVYPYTTGTLGTPTNTILYVYGNSKFPDRLTSYDGKSITYDTSGYPKNYMGWTMTWKAGGLLATAKKGTKSISLSYDKNGRIIKKTVNGKITNFEYNETFSKISLIDDGTNKLKFFYNSNGRLLGFSQNSVNYLYGLDVLGNVDRIINLSGDVVSRYTYDAWGGCSVSGMSKNTRLGNVNPLRHKGAYYDSDLELYIFYALHSRPKYYDPKTGRYINPCNDSSSNLYAYNASNSALNSAAVTPKISKSVNSGVKGASGRNCFYHAVDRERRFGMDGGAPDYNIPTALGTGYRVFKTNKNHSLNPHEVMIAFREGFHYMRKAYGDRYWTHKMGYGNQMILNLIGNPWDYDVWSDETWEYDKNGKVTYLPPIGYFSGDIKYYWYQSTGSLGSMGGHDTGELMFRQ